MGEAVSNSLPLNIVTVFIPVLFYFLGLSSNLEQFKRIFIEKKSLIYGLGIQLILLPLIGLLISELFSNSLFAVAAVVVLIVPGGQELFSAQIQADEQCSSIKQGLSD